MHYGFCPTCGAPGRLRERRINGNDICENNHTYPSKNAIQKQITECQYIIAWIGNCKEDSEHNSEFCKKHLQEKCISCGAQATHQCDETMGPFVCGASLCDNCEHTLCENGCNSGAALPEGLKGHCKKTEQVYLPWYHPEFKEKG